MQYLNNRQPYGQSHFLKIVKFFVLINGALLMAFLIKTSECVLFLTSCNSMPRYQDTTAEKHSVSRRGVLLICPRNFNLEPPLTRTQGPIHETYTHTIACISPYSISRKLLLLCGSAYFGIHIRLTADVREIPIWRLFFNCIRILICRTVLYNFTLEFLLLSSILTSL